MSSVRDSNNPPSVGNVGLGPTPGPEQAPEAHAPLTAAQTDAVRAANAAREALEASQAKREAKQTDFERKFNDVPGFGDKEGDEAKGLKGAFKTAGVAQPLPQNARAMHAQVKDTPEFAGAVDQMKSVLSGEAPVPSTAQMTDMVQRLAQSAGVTQTGGTVGAGGSIGAGETPAAPSAAGQNVAPSQQQAAGAGTANAAAEGAQVPAAAGVAKATVAAADATVATATSKIPMTSNNATALVFLVMLEAQQELVKEKGDTLRHIKMLNGMQADLNDMISSELIPAQQQITLAQSKGDPAKDNRVTVPVTFPSSIDTQNASVDEAGKIRINAVYGNSTSSGRTLQNAQGISNLISQAQQWNTTISNNQTQQSNRFQAQDNNMTSTWNIINAVLKNHQDGVNAILRNV